MTGHEDLDRELDVVRSDACTHVGEMRSPRAGHLSSVVFYKDGVGTMTRLDLTVGEVYVQLSLSWLRACAVLYL